MGKKEKIKEYRISPQELKTLLFWSAVGAKYSVCGHRSEKLPESFVKWMRKLGLKRIDFLPFNSQNTKLLGQDILDSLKMMERAEGKKIY